MTPVFEHLGAAEASFILLSVAVAQLVCGLLGACWQNSAGNTDGFAFAATIGLIVAATAGYTALSFWARSSPAPAALVGLVIYVGLGVLQVGRPQPGDPRQPREPAAAGAVPRAG